MQVYTGMVDALDFHVGRLIDCLREVDEFDNTLIVVILDNGPSGGDRFELGNNERWIPANFDNRHENMGRRGSYIAYGLQWAQVSSTSYRMYKTFTAEGGIVAPAIISFPAELARNRVSHQSASILDVVPTLLQVVNLDVQDNSQHQRTVLPLQSVSMLPLLRGEKEVIHTSDYSMGWEFFGRREIRQGGWKMVWLNTPWGKGGWELFNLAVDPAEEFDLSEKLPDKQGMLLVW